MRRKPRRKGYRMLLCNADIEGARRVRLGEFVNAGTARHRGSDGDDPVIGFGQLGERFTKNILVGGRAATGALVLLAGDDVELDHAMIFVRCRLSRGIAMALFGDDVDQARPLCRIADIFEDGDEVIEIVAVNRADIVKAQFLEQRAAHRHAARKFIGLARCDMERFGQFARNALGDFAQRKEGPRGNQPRQIGRKPAHRRRDRHVIVVKDDNKAIARCLRVVHRLIGHARRHRTIADHGNRLAGFVVQLVGNRKAQGRRNRGRAVRRAERIIFALGALGEA